MTEMSLQSMAEPEEIFGVEGKIFGCMACTSDSLRCTIQLSSWFLVLTVRSFRWKIIDQSAEHGNCTHKKICSRATCTPKIRPCMHPLYAYRLNIGSPGVAYCLNSLVHLNQMCTPLTPYFLPCMCKIPSSSAMLCRLDHR